MIHKMTKQPPSPSPDSPLRFAPIGGEAADMKNCKLCRYSHLCNDLPGICVLIPHVTVVIIGLTMAYLFVTQELM